MPGSSCLVVGGGGREHAIAWRLARSRGVNTVWVAPGNAGTAREPKVKNLAITDAARLADFCEREGIEFTVVGPEAPLAAGIVDLFQARGLAIFGPSRAAARLESSKDFAKSFMLRHQIPSALSRTFADAGEAHAFVTERGAPIVVKADGLAAGKGVVVAMDVADAHAAIDRMLVDNRLGDAGARVVIEEYLEGEEASFIVMVDGKNVLALASSQDHKRLCDGDEGPNTGGMGAFSPTPLVTPDLHARVLREIILPTVAGMAAEGHPLNGFLYAGLMIDKHGTPRTLEFNCRLGDPEAQVIMARLRTDFARLLRAAIKGRLDAEEAQWDRRNAICIVLAAAGYPDAPRAGDPISGLAANGNPLESETMVFHAGTREAEDGRVLTAGGRVLGVTALGDTLKMAHTQAYAALDAIRFDGMQYRQDIGHRAMPAPGSR